ncbi:hypothetical protein VNO78_34926 [Psophocarpus tetragonolobus]|uniref:Uncharacterized protein n=1 Tax=Psophocarpus tetragonolobus TaxID=3891 RepID=A0AAN9NT30_PSOTE
MAAITVMVSSKTFKLQTLFLRPVKKSGHVTPKGKHAFLFQKGEAQWHSREEQKIDREYDVVVVSFDGGYISDFEFDYSD